ncbi:MAG: hypothetical protein CML20_04860 [Rheinheimera sp.]|uniref:hypothetical protein n=1 Tax=Arsukibacterium sp. UBA3155 TaxID=1946058 RepID=UPI000C91E62F|nr:hypothetical protein [Arsukibacterium sp. UBA3155]MAD74120.1 hypothetical protein [Rheinheimera sp.]
MKKTISILSLIVLSGCQQENSSFDVKEVGNATYLINKKSGELSVVENGNVIALQEYKLPEKNKLSLSGDFDEKIHFELKTKFIFDRIYYKLILKGYSSKELNDQGLYIDKIEDFNWFVNEIKNNEYDQISIQLTDSDGFTLKEEEIYLAKNYVRFSDKEHGITGFQYEGSFFINPLILNDVTSLRYTYMINSLKKAPE